MNLRVSPLRFTNQRLGVHVRHRDSITDYRITGLSHQPPTPPPAASPRRTTSNSTDNHPSSTFKKHTKLFRRSASRAITPRALIRSISQLLAQPLSPDLQLRRRSSLVLISSKPKNTAIIRRLNFQPPPRPLSTLAHPIPSTKLDFRVSIGVGLVTGYRFPNSSHITCSWPLSPRALPIPKQPSSTINTAEPLWQVLWHRPRELDTKRLIHHLSSRRRLAVQRCVDAIALFDLTSRCQAQAVVIRHLSKSTRFVIQFFFQRRDAAAQLSRAPIRFGSSFHTLTLSKAVGRV